MCPCRRDPPALLSRCSHLGNFGCQRSLEILCPEQDTWEHQWHAWRAWSQLSALSKHRAWPESLFSPSAWGTEFHAHSLSRVLGTCKIHGNGTAILAACAHSAHQHREADAQATWELSQFCAFLSRLWAQGRCWRGASQEDSELALENAVCTGDGWPSSPQETKPWWLGMLRDRESTGHELWQDCLLPHFPLTFCL